MDDRPSSGAAKNQTQPEDSKLHEDVQNGGIDENVKNGGLESSAPRTKIFSDPKFSGKSKEAMENTTDKKDSNERDDIGSDKPSGNATLENKNSRSASQVAGATVASVDISRVVVDLTTDLESDADAAATKKQYEEPESARDGPDIVHRVFGSLLQTANAMSREAGGTSLYPEAHRDGGEVEGKFHRTAFSVIESGALRKDPNIKKDYRKSVSRSHQRQSQVTEETHETGHEKQDTGETAPGVISENEKLQKSVDVVPEKAAVSLLPGHSDPSGVLKQIIHQAEEQGGNSNVSNTVLPSDTVRESLGEDTSYRTYRKGVWLLPELMALQAAKREQYDSVVKVGYRVKNSKPEKERWQEIENFCWRQGVHRSGDQCHARWEYIAREFRKIFEYENSGPHGHSYWQMSQIERKEKDLPMNFHYELFQVMVDWMGSGRAAITGAVATNPLIPSLITSASLPEWLVSGRAIPPDMIASPSALSLDRMNCVKPGDPSGSIPVPFHLPDGGMDSSQTSSRNNLDELDPRSNGKRRKTTSKRTDGALGVETNTRYVVPKEPATVKADDGGLLLCNCSVVHLGMTPVVSRGEHILIKNKHIAYIGPSPLLASQMVDLAGRYVMPGLCDAHVHVTAVTANLHDLGLISSSLITARASKVLRDMLMRGFTTVRDVGGCDWGLSKAVEEGTIVGPRILFSGHALSQTGGHGDMRLPNEDDICSCSSALTLGRVCDGVPEVRRAARDELRKGAHQIKIMASGGVSSPTDHLSSLQFSSEEIAAIVEEASHVGKYVCAHAYTSAAAKRALELGVRSIEHGNLLDEDCIDLIKRKGAYLVPTLVTYDQIRKRGEASGMTADLVAKVGNLLERGLEVLSLADRKGVNICFGTDLLGDMHAYQLEELALRSKVQSSAAILRSATSTCAQLFRMDGKVGTLAEGAFADILVLEKNPIADISVLEDSSNLMMILKEGEIVKLSKQTVSKVVDGRTLIRLS